MGLISSWCMSMLIMLCLPLVYAICQYICVHVHVGVSVGMGWCVTSTYLWEITWVSTAYILLIYKKKWN